MHTRFIAALGVSAVTAALAATAAPARATAPAALQSEERLAQGQALTASRCTGCHGLSKVTTAGRSADAWRATVDEMIRLGAEVNAEEAAAIVAYLAANFPGRP